MQGRLFLKKLVLKEDSRKGCGFVSGVLSVILVRFWSGEAWGEGVRRAS